MTAEPVVRSTRNVGQRVSIFPRAALMPLDSNWTCQAVLKYLAPYVYRTAISDNRIVECGKQRWTQEPTLRLAWLWSVSFAA